MMHASDKELNEALDRATRLDTARERLDTARLSRTDSVRGDAAAPAALSHEDSLRRALVSALHAAPLIMHRVCMCVCIYNIYIHWSPLCTMPH